MPKLLFVMVDMNRVKTSHKYRFVKWSHQRSTENYVFRVELLINWSPNQSLIVGPFIFFIMSSMDTFVINNTKHNQQCINKQDKYRNLYKTKNLNVQRYISI